MKAGMPKKYLGEKSASSDNENASKHFEIGMDYYNSDNQQTAYIYFKKAYELNPNNNLIRHKFQEVKEELGIPENFNNAQMVPQDPDLNYINFRTAVKVVDCLKKDIESLMQQIAVERSRGDKIENRVDEIVETLDLIGGTRQAAVIKAIDGFKNEPELYKYYQTFYSTITTLFEAYKILGPGIVATELNEFAGTYFKALKIAGCCLANAAEMSTTFFLPVAGPFICSAHEFSTSIYEYMMGKKIDNHTNCIKEIIAKKFEFQNIHTELGELAIAITKTNRERILGADIEDNKNLQQSRLAYLKQKMFGTISENEEDTPIKKLASDDVALFLTYVFKNHESILNKNNKLTFCKQIETILDTTNLLTDTYNETLQNVIPKNDVLEIEYLTLEGTWDPPKESQKSWYSKIPGWFSSAPKGVSDFFKEDYIKKICKGSILSWKADLARVAILSKMCNALVRDNSEKLECLVEVSKNYPHIIKDMLRLCPDQFGNNELAKKSIEHTPFALNIKNDLLLLSDSSFNANGDPLDDFHIIPLIGTP